MKICHVISSVDKNYGGTTEYLRLTANQLANHTSNTILSMNSESPVKFKEDVNVILEENHSKIGFFSRKFKNTLYDIDCDLFHGNGLWENPVHQMSKIAIKRNIPYLISVHGMLEPWSLKQGNIKKNIALTLFQRKDLHLSNCLHATAHEEALNIRRLGLTNPIAVIPNGVSVDIFSEDVPIKSSNKILFLSRIHIKKGIENLIDAWKLINEDVRQNWKIDIIGNGDEDYIKKLKDKIIHEKLNNQIEIKKPVFGVEKIKLFRDASLFVLPTFSENFGIVIAEALASYTPVITTKGAPWKDLETHKSGWWIDIGVQPLKFALEEAMLKTSVELLDMGRNGRALVKAKYSMESVAKQMIELYNWVLTKKNKPSFVDTI